MCKSMPNWVISVSNERTLSVKSTLGGKLIFFAAIAMATIAAANDNAIATASAAAGFMDVVGTTMIEVDVKD